MKERELIYFDKPYGDEAYFDYLFRIAKNNGFSSLKKFQAWLLLESHGPKHQISKYDSREIYSRFLDSLNLSNDALFHVEKYSTAYDDDIKIYAKYLENDNKFKYCPYCLDETGYVSYIWSFKDVSFCYKHSTKLISSKTHPYFIETDQIKPLQQVKLDVDDFKNSVLGRSYLKFEKEPNSIKHVFHEMLTSEFELSLLSKISKYWYLNSPNYFSVRKKITEGYYVQFPLKKRLEIILDDLFEQTIDKPSYDEYFISRSFVDAMSRDSYLPDEYLDWARELILSKNYLIDVLLFKHSFSEYSFTFNLHDTCHFGRCSNKFNWIYNYSKTEFMALERFCNLAKPMFNFDLQVVKDYVKKCTEVNSEGAENTCYPTFSEFCDSHGYDFRGVLFDPICKH